MGYDKITKAGIFIVAEDLQMIIATILEGDLIPLPPQITIIKILTNDSMWDAGVTE